MTWRELWKSTVTNLRVLLGFSPPPQQATTRNVAPPPRATLKPPTLQRPTLHETTLHENREELTSARSLATQKTVTQTRKPPSLASHSMPVDVALDAAAFAALPSRPEAGPELKPEISPEITWTRQGVAHIEEIAEEITEEVTREGHVTPFDNDELSAHDNGDENNGAGGGDDAGDDAGDNGGHDRGDRYEDNEYTNDEEGIPLTTLLESLLFVAPEPVEPRQLAQTLAQPLDMIELGLAELADYYQRSLRGLRLQRFNDKVQLVTTPVAAPFIESFLNLDNSTRLSSPALETLAVIAYRQPVTRAQIEAVRGVDCAGVLRSLVQRGLVTEMGRMEGVGRPILYGVTEMFMQHFGLVEMGELPPLEEAEADRLWAATILDEQEATSPQA
jgi:segregation and condensation protein B